MIISKIMDILITLINFVNKADPDGKFDLIN